MRDSTPEQCTEFGNFHGNKLYEKRARAALPLLVRQAQAQQRIHYSGLAEELGMPNPRNLNYVLGLIGATLINLNEDLELNIPPVQSLVVNKSTGLPGEGIHFFLPDGKNFQRLSNEQKRIYLNSIQAEIFTFPHWEAVLSHLGLNPAKQISRGLSDAIDASARKYGAGGEGRYHKALKELISRKPSTMGIFGSFDENITEKILKSGDTIDVSLRNKHEWVCIEVKGIDSDVGDIGRGLFQCVKYAAVMEGTRKFEQAKYKIKAILALGGQFPQSLLPLKNLLEVDVVDKLQMS